MWGKSSLHLPIFPSRLRYTVSCLCCAPRELKMHLHIVKNNTKKWSEEGTIGRGERHREEIMKLLQSRNTLASIHLKHLVRMQLNGSLECSFTRPSGVGYSYLGASCHGRSKCSITKAPKFSAVAPVIVTAALSPS